jgi:hypothetical protein
MKLKEDGSVEVKSSFKQLLSREKNKKLLSVGLSQNELPFHWKMVELPSFLYDGEPYTARATRIGVNGSLLEDFFEILKKEVAEDGLNDEDRTVLENLWDEVTDNLSEMHSDDEMIGFYEFDLADMDGEKILLLRYGVID